MSPDATGVEVGNPAGAEQIDPNLLNDSAIFCGDSA
jgi:hypothetical protein